MKRFKQTWGAHPTQTEVERSLASMLSKQILITGIFLGTAVLCFASQPRNSLVFEYEDFGPQTAVYDSLGYQWFQWNDHGDSDPRKVDEIKVVVYNNMVSLKNVSKMYSVDKATLQDYRYIECQSTLELIQRNISQVKPDDWEGADRLLKRLRKTRSRIEQELGCKRTNQ